jgi:hypothetical protein
MIKAQLNISEVAEAADLEALVRGICGPGDGKGKYICPFHDDHTPSLEITRHSGRQRFKCWACGAAGDAVEWLSRLRGIDALEAAARLAGVDDPRTESREKAKLFRPLKTPQMKTLKLDDKSSQDTPADSVATPPRPPDETLACLDPEWQREVERMVRRGEDYLWSTVGQDARSYLSGRGLSSETIRRHRLGWLSDGITSAELRPDLAARLWPDPDRCARARSRLYAPRGIIIPWPKSGGGWWGANIRRLPEGNLRGKLPDGVGKTQCLTGSRRGNLYPLPEITPDRPVVVAEGEFDALLAWQDCRSLAEVASIGGAGQRPTATAEASLRSATIWLLALDSDQAGDKGFRIWTDLDTDKSYRILVPAGADIGDAHQAGVDLRAWVKNELTRLKQSIEPTPRWRLDLETWPADLIEDFEERAAIMEFDGGLSRSAAELAAYHLLVGRLNQANDLFGPINNRPVRNGRGPYQSGF